MGDLDVNGEWIDHVHLYQKHFTVLHLQRQWLIHEITLTVSSEYL
jgi:hypothetical protein